MATKSGKIRSLQVRPSQSVDLSFNMPGVINFPANPAKHPQIGQSVKGFALNELYDAIEAKEDSEGRLKFDAKQISSFLLGKNAVLLGLRNEALKASLDQAVIQRENSVLERFAHIDAIVKLMESLYPNGEDWFGASVDPKEVKENVPDGRLMRLKTMLEASRKRFSALHEQYNKAGQWKAKNSTTTTNTPMGKTDTTTTVENLPGPFNREQVVELKKKGEEKAFQTITHTATDFSWEDVAKKRTQTITTDYGEKGKNFTREMMTTFREFTHPGLENVIRFEKSQLAILDQVIDELLNSKARPKVEKILKNELDMLDLEVRKLQLNYSHTFLVSPIDGIVTAIYKDVGESVKTGEAVMRVENNKSLYLVGRISFRGVLHVTADEEDGPITLTTTSVFETGETLTLSKVKIASVRGHDSDNDEWDIILKCPNPVDGAGRAILPINYHFDRDNTIITMQV